MSAYAVEVYGQLGYGAGHCRLQRGSELLHEQEEKPPDHSDVHGLVQQVSSECRIEKVISGQHEMEANSLMLPFGLFPGFGCESLGCSRAAHPIWGQSPSAGRDVTCDADRISENVILLRSTHWCETMMRLLWLRKKDYSSPAQGERLKGFDVYFNHFLLFNLLGNICSINDLMKKKMLSDGNLNIMRWHIRIPANQVKLLYFPMFVFRAKRVSWCYGRCRAERFSSCWAAQRGRISVPRSRLSWQR